MTVTTRAAKGSPLTHTELDANFTSLQDEVDNLTPTSLILPSAAVPAQTAEGSVVWDTDNDLLTIGTGTQRRTMVDLDSPQTLTGKTLTDPTINAAGGSLTLPSGSGVTTEGVIQWNTSADLLTVGRGATTATMVDTSGTQTLTGKTINLSNNTLTGTLVEFNTAISDANVPSRNEAAMLGLNYALSASVAANALTIALKNAAGSDPSSNDPVTIAFRNATATTGTPSVLTITAALSLVVSSGSTLGTVNSIPHRLWVVLFNDGGTARLGIINTQASDGLMPLADDVLTSSTAEGGAGGADSAGVIYTDSAVSSKGMRVLGYIESTQTTAGTWATAPSKLQIWQPTMKISGDVVQVRRVVSTTYTTTTATIPFDDTIPQSSEGTELFTQAITPTSAINRLEIKVRLSGARSASDGRIASALFQDSTANALSSGWGSQGANQAILMSYAHFMAAGTTSSTTFKVRYAVNGGEGGTASINGTDTTRIHGGVMASYMEITERMA